MISESQAHDNVCAHKFRPNSSPTPDFEPEPHAPSDHYWLDVLESAVEHGLADPDDASALQVQMAVDLVPLGEMQEKVAALLASGAAPGAALDCIARVFNGGDVIELRAVCPNGGGAWSLCGRLSLPEERERMLGFIRKHVGRDNLYFGINPRKPEMAGTARSGRANDIVARRMAVLDLDLKDAPDADPNWTRTCEALRALNPILEINSGNGFHFWFLIEGVDSANLPASVGPLAEAMARLGADNMSDLPRIARLPYTVNLPTKTKRQRGAVVRLAVPVQE